MTKTKTPSKSKKSCDCFELVQKKLEEQGTNTVMDSSLSIDFSTGKASKVGPLIAVHKRDSKSRKATAVLVCSYCPFCGKKKENQ